MKNLVLLTIIGFIMFMGAGVTGPISSLYFESLGANYATIGVLGTVMSLSAIVFSHVWGQASDHFRRRKVFLAGGLAVVAVCDALIAAAPSYHFLFPLRVVAAAAQTAYGTSSLALMGDILEQRPQARGRRMGIYRGLGSLGFGLVAFVSGSLADWFSLAFPYYLAAIFCGIAFVLALGIREPSTEARPITLRSSSGFVRSLGVGLAAWLKARLRDGAALLRQVRHGRPAAAGDNVPVASVDTSRADIDKPVTSSGDESPRLPLAPLLIAAFLWSLVTGAVYAVWANYMVSQIGYSTAEMARLWAIASLSEFPLMIVAGWLSDRIGRLPMLSLGFVAWTIVFLGYVLAPSTPWIVVIQLIRGFAYSAFTATAMTYATEVRGKEARGRISGLYSSVNGIGAILGSPLGGGLTQLAGFVVMILTNAALIGGGAAYLAITAVRHRVRLVAGRRRSA
ncbi:MAG: MFS transporter [Anaerolineae bacterium]|nr:MFS transporter [Anaerolineae bacterium]